MTSTPLHTLSSLQIQQPPLTTLTATPKPSSNSRQWVEAIRTHTRSGRHHQALTAYVDMTRSGLNPDNFAFPAALKSAAAIHEVNAVRQLHAHVVKFGYGSGQVTVANSLVNAYGKCGEERDAYKVFDAMIERDQVSWNSMIAALCRFEEWELALDAFRSMFEDNVGPPSSFSLVSVALACSNLGKREGLRIGKEVHGYSLRAGEVETFTVNALMAMYAKLGMVGSARGVFELFDGCDLVSWNTMICSLAQNDVFDEALRFFRLMIREGFRPDGVAIASVLPACSHLEMLEAGKEIHAYALRADELTGNSFVGSALVDMYCNCRRVESGRRVFDVVTERKIPLWNALITGYAQNEYDEEALELFLEMYAVWGLTPNSTTMSSIVPACVRCEAFSGKESIHAFVIKQSLEKNRYVQNALMDMYSRMGRTGVSETIFNNMEGKDIVSWNTMITGYVISGRHDEALNLLYQMQRVEENKNADGTGYDDERRVPLKPNTITLMTLLPSCAVLSALGKGKEIHAHATRHLLAQDIAVGSALVDMYAKCGCLDLSRAMFNQMPVKNVITWNVLIMAYGMHGRGEEAFELFKNMVDEGRWNKEVRPNRVTFIAIFAACSHSGMVDKGLNLFHIMKQDHGIDPAPDHYACVVDLLGRAGSVERAYEIVKTMPSEFDKAGAWSSLLGACRIHQNVEIGEIAANHLLQLEPDVASHYVLLSNIYSSSGLWEKAVDVRKKMKEMGVKKEPGCSWIEFEDEVHKFLAGDMSHPQSEQLHEYLENLSERMKKEGYVPDTSCVLHNVDEDEKETLLCGHSEKLAMAFGLINTRPGTTIRVAKNLRVCNDCHLAAKYISKMMDRDIILRDVRRFHHFRNGNCSCGDYW